MVQTLIAAFLVAHGVITTAIGASSMMPPGAPGLPNPTWRGWWPTAFGRSWVIDGLHLGSGAGVAGGLLWTAAGLAFIGAGLGIVGMPGLREVWQPLGLGAGTLALVALCLYFHPWYFLAVLINAAIVALLWGTVRAPVAGLT